MQITHASTSATIESLIGSLIGGQEALLHALGVADTYPRNLQPRPSAVVRQVAERRQLESLIATARAEASFLLSDDAAETPRHDLLLAHVLDLLGRGVACRVLLNPSARADSASLEWTRRASGLGGELRWITEEFKPMILIDRRSALVLDGTRSAGALLITEPTLVEVMARVFGNAWNGARCLAVPDPAPRDPVMPASSVRESIVDMLISGCPDKTIARQLGISLRSVQAHVATLRAELGASTRAQLGYLLGRARLDDEETTVPAGAPAVRQPLRIAR